MCVCLCLLSLDCRWHIAPLSRWAKALLLLLSCRMPWNIRESNAVEMMDLISHCRNACANSNHEFAFSNAQNDEIIVCGFLLVRSRALTARSKPISHSNFVEAKGIQSFFFRMHSVMPWFSVLCQIYNQNVTATQWLACKRRTLNANKKLHPRF